jgi:YegS/Rv2252/BmrU family lipid kinase
MRTAVLLYNPFSGRHRVEQVHAARDVLRAAGVNAEAIATRASGSAGQQAREAVAHGADTIFACGGDGTVHDVLQGIVGTDIALGVIPLGTANALAADLGLPHRATAAAQRALTFEPRHISVGAVEFQTPSGADTRYFVVAAGAGPDAHLMYKLNPQLKRRFGMTAYYVHATWVWATHTYPRFRVEFFDTDEARRRTESVTQVLAIRIGVFGGLLHQLAPGASLVRDDFRLVLFKTSSRARYLAYILRCVARGFWNIPGVELVNATELTCSAAETRRRIYVEADGELLGAVPARMSLRPAAIQLLMPRTNVPHQTAEASTERITNR